MRGAVASLALTGLLLLHAVTRGQDSPKVQFEVASVRTTGALTKEENREPGRRSGGPGTTDPGRITYSKQYLNLILADAFDVYWDRISGPDWIGAERYDIAAKVPEGATREQARQMLQNLLVERFHLTFHMQTKLLPGYELSVAPAGSKLKESVPASQAPTEASPANLSLPVDKDGFPILPPGVRLSIRRTPGHIYMSFADTSIPDFAKVLANIPSPGSMVIVASGLSSWLSRGAPTPVLDKTGMTGTYDFTFGYDGSSLFPPDAVPRIMGAVKSSLEKQLGLKLLEAKVPVNTLVVDHVEMTPTEN